MAEFTSPAWYAARAIRDGQSARAGLASFRAAGGAIRDDYWFQLYAATQDAFIMRETELGTPLNRRPVAGEITPWQTTNATGYAQQLVVFTRDRGTSEITPHEFTIATDRLMSRSAAIAHAIGSFDVETSDEGSFPDQDVLGAAYVGTFEMVPADQS